MEKKKIALAAVAATAIALSSGQSAFAEGTNTEQPSQSSTSDSTENKSNTTSQKKTISKVEKISKTEIVVIYNEEVTEGADNLTTELVVKNPSGKQVTLTAYKIDETNKKKVTYTFTTDFAYGKWTVDGEHFYTVEREKIADYVGLEVVRITKDGVVLKLPKDKNISSEELSVKDPKGNEIAVQKPSSPDSEGTVTYKFSSTMTSIEPGTWTINMDTKFKVLTEEENKAKVEAVQKKIKTAKLTLSTSKNYVKNILAAQAAYDALTMEQKSLLPVTSTDKNIMSKNDLETLYNDILGVNGVYTPVKNFEDKIKSLVSNSNTFVADVKAAENVYNALTKEQLSYVDAKIKKQYTAYLNEAAIQDGINNVTTVAKNADKIIAFNKAYKKLTVAQKEPLLLDATSKKTIEALTDKTLQKNASAALAVQKKFNKLEIQKKNDKNKKLYYTEEKQQDGTTKKVETTTKTSEPVMVYSLSAVTKAQTALVALEKKNKAAYDLVDPKLLNEAKKDSTIQASIAKGESFNDAVKAPSDITDFVSEFTKAKTAYIALTADEKKYAIDKNALKQYKAYLKIDKVAVMYAKMTAPEQTTKSMKLAHDTSNTVSSITNDVKFSKGKFTIPKGNYEFAFKDGDKAKVAYYKDGKWTVADTLPELTKTIATAQEIYAYAKAFNALKDADEAILTKGTNGAVYKQYVGKENDYKKAAAVEKKIVSAVKSKRKATIANAQKAYDALTAAQQPLVTNSGDLSALQK